MSVQQASRESGKQIEVEADNKSVEKYGAQASDNNILAKAIADKGCQECSEAAKYDINGTKGSKDV